ncbi:SAM-dependent methyltransferase [Candidatus Peregrinibacteria bacterium]|nr:SAM-dependent methyltransferase [Candidatus Peregrinibacteria bacterium]
MSSKTVTASRIPGSFRDPSGFLFIEEGTLYRSVSLLYQKNYDCLMQSGLFRKLISENLLIPHVEVPFSSENSNDRYKLIQPEIIPFVSYPYEWCFSQLKDAALALLRIQKLALDFDMSLKDASAYNMQFANGRPVLIDTLSFEIYKENQPWVAYRQFCQHFLAPLALMAYRDIRLHQLLRVYIDGPPLNLVSSLLPISTWFRPALLFHVHLHAKAQKRYANNDGQVPAGRSFTKHSLIALISHLESAVAGLKWRPSGTEWADYYEDTNYTQQALEIKKRHIESYLDISNPHTVWDLGANTGMFSRVASSKAVYTIAFDIDPAAVEKNYLHIRQNNEMKLLPLCLDMTNPSSAIGWANEERSSLTDRGPADTVLALALIHHLAISNNLPLVNVAAYFSRLCEFLIIEFVPKNDSQVQRLLRTREDIFPDYTLDQFEEMFSRHFQILKSEKIEGTQRTLYLMKRK